MDSTRKDAIDAVHMEEAALSRTVKVSKATVTILACIGIYSSNSYAVEAITITGPLEGKTILHVTAPSTIEVKKGEEAPSLTPVNVTGSWEYYYNNPTDKKGTFDLHADFDVINKDTGHNVFHENARIIDTATLPPHSSATFDHPHQDSINGPALSIEPGFGKGNYQLIVTSTTALAPATADFTVKEIPEPETYAMMLAGLGLLGWRLRRSRG